MAATIDELRGEPPSGGRRRRVVLPSRRDPRLWQSGVLLSVQALGQLSLRFELSIAQLLVALGTAAVLEVVITARRQRVLAWPASALLTGNGVALVLRVPGTAHGDWWSLRGWWLFAGCAALSLGSKYVLRVAGRPVFNPSNLGLVVILVALGPGRADAQPLWWGDLDPGLALTAVLVIGGGVVVLRRLGLGVLALAFLVTLGTLVGVLTASGHCMTAPWNVGPVCGASFWWVLLSSPELLIFALFMITDPRTTPTSRRGRAWFGAAVGATAAVMIAPQRTEFATKTALLGSLTVVSVLWAARRWRQGRAADRATRAAPSMSRRVGVLVPATAVGLAILVVLVVVTAGTPARPDSFARGPVPLAGGATGPDSTDPARSTPLPPVVIEPGAVELDPRFDQGTAEQMAADLVEDLDTLARAAERLDPALVARAAAGQPRDDAVRAIEAARADGRTEVRDYRAHAIRALLVRVPGSAQAIPEIGLEIDATVHWRVLTAPGPDGTSAVLETGQWEERRAFRLAPDEAGVRYLIAGPAEVWTRPAG